MLVSIIIIELIINLISWYCQNHVTFGIDYLISVNSVESYKSVYWKWNRIIFC